MAVKTSYMKMHEGCQRLWYMLANGADSNAIILEAFKLIGNPIIINTLEVHFKSIGVKTNDLINQSYMVGYESTRNAIDDSIYIPPENLNIPTKYGFVCAGIFDKKKFLGRVIIAGEHHPFSESDGEYAKTLAKIMANIFSAETFSQINSTIPDFPLFHSFLTGEQLDINRVRIQLSKLDFCPEEGMNIIIIDQRSEPLLAAMANMKKYANLLGCKIYALYHGNIVTINSRIGGRKLAVSEFFRQELIKQGLVCGVSREFYNLRYIPMMYEQAMFALNIGRFFDEQDSVLEYEKYSTEYSICHSAKSSHPLHMLDPRLIKLKEYDYNGPGYLIDTLKTHLHNLKTPTAGAESLHIHRNTYFHRLNKIEEMTGWDINDGFCIAKLAFYLKIIGLLEQADIKGVKDISYLVDET